MREPFGYWWWHVRRYYPALLRRWFMDTLPCHLAWLLPRKVAYWAFIRVYATLDSPGDDFKRVCDAWEQQL